MKKIGLIFFMLTLMTFLASGCEVKKSEDELREEIKAELVAEEEAKALALEEAKKEADLKALEEEAQQVNEIQEDKVLKIMTAKLNVRRDPVIDSSKVGQITSEATYTLLDEEVRPDGHRWYKIMFEPDKEGWIAAWYTLKNSEYTKRIGRGNLIKAFDGKIDTMLQGIGDPISEYVKGKGEPTSKENYNGGQVYIYPSMSVLVYGDGGGEAEAGDIASIIYFGSDKMYGVSIGNSKEEVNKVLGEPDKMDLNFTDEVESFYVNADLYTYYTGSYVLVFAFNSSNQLEKIVLTED